MTRILVPAVLPRPRMGRGAAQGCTITAFDGQIMGTGWSVRLAYPPGAAPLSVLRRLIDTELDRIVAEMSHWDPDSALSRFNRSPAGSWHDLPPGFFTVLDYALTVAAAGRGAYDPAIGRLVDLWGFGPRRGIAPARTAPPCGAEIAAVRAAGDYRALMLDRSGRRVRQPGGLRLDFSAVAKGYAVDRVAHVLGGAGIADCLVEIGGELLGRGTKPDGTPWWVAIEPPDGLAVPPIRIALCGLAVATSGDYRRFFEAGGVRHAHTLDPRTGAPVAHRLAAVTVLHPICMHADALSTLLTVLGPEEGMAYAARNGLAAQFIERTGRAGFVEHLSPAFAAMLD